MKQAEQTKTWSGPLRRFLESSGRDARRALAMPTLLRPTPLWHQRAGAVLVVLALIQGARLLDRALLPVEATSPQQAGIVELDASDWDSWSQRMGMPGADYFRGPESLLRPRGEIGASFASTSLLAGSGPQGSEAPVSNADWIPWQRLGGNARPHRFFQIQVTGYSSRICETDSTPTVTAAGTETAIGTIALSRDLLRTFAPDAPFDFGDKVLIPGLGVFEVWDTMNPRWVRKADIWFDSTDRALRFGRRTAFITRVSDAAPVLADRLP